MVPYLASNTLEREQCRPICCLSLLSLPDGHAEHPLPNGSPLLVLRPSSRREHFLHRRRAKLLQQVVPLSLMVEKHWHTVS